MDEGCLKAVKPQVIHVSVPFFYLMLPSGTVCSSALFHITAHDIFSNSFLVSKALLLKYNKSCMMTHIAE